MGLVELAGRRDELVEVGEPVLTVAAGLGRQVFAIAGLGQEPADHFLGRQLAQGGQLIDQPGEVVESSGRPSP